MDVGNFALGNGLNEGFFFSNFKKLTLEEQDILKKRLRELAASIDLCQNLYLEGNDRNQDLQAERCAHDFYQLILDFIFREFHQELNKD